MPNGDGFRPGRPTGRGFPDALSGVEIGFFAGWKDCVRRPLGMTVLADLYKQSPIAFLAATALFLYVLLKAVLQKKGSAGEKPVVLEEIKKEKLFLRGISAEEVARHRIEKDLWIIIDNEVYDLTKFVPDHPGGRAILRNAGGDATAGFHGPQHPNRVYNMLPDFHIGHLIRDDLTAEEVARHNKEEDCYIIVKGAVYDVTSWVDSHPGGKSVLLSHAGTDATTEFFGTQHPASVRAMIDKYYVGKLAAPAKK